MRLSPLTHIRRDILKKVSQLIRIAILSLFATDVALAEREGFKPPKRTSRFPDFESGPFGHSGISPERVGEASY